jgi:hypothetical protein
LQGAQVVRWSQNHAGVSATPGGINGWRARYKPGTAALEQATRPRRAEGASGLSQRQVFHPRLGGHAWMAAVAALGETVVELVHDAKA